MPELPEVETIVRDLNNSVKGQKIKDAWVDREKIIKQISFKDFVRRVRGRKIVKVRRRAKYILIDLTDNQTMIVHQKISGHLLCGKWKIENNKPKCLSSGPLKSDSQNGYIRLVLFLNNGKAIGLSDLRRFAKVLLIDTNKVEQLKEIKELGPEPMEKSFDLDVFKQIIIKKSGKIKQVLMDPKVISGIGNIYSDEILWYAKINPIRPANSLKHNELKAIYQSMKKVLQIAIDSKGDSMKDYRRLSGELGGYQYRQKVYQATGTKCKRNDGGIIKRIKVNSRSAHFCPVCQK